MSDFESLWNTAVAQGEERKRDRPVSFYGKLEIEGRPVVFEKGAPMGRRDFDPEMDPDDARRLEIRLTVRPVSERATRDFERAFVVQSREGDMFKDSLVSLGVTIPQLQQSPFVRVDLVEDPRLGTYNDRTTGVPRTRAAAVLREVFPNEDACRAAADARYSGGAGNGSGSWAQALGGNPSTPPAPAMAGAPPTAGAGNAPSKRTAMQFFPGIWSGCGQDPEKFIERLKTNKLMQGFFPEPDAAPEVREFLVKMGHPEFSEGADGGNPIDLTDTPF